MSKRSNIVLSFVLAATFVSGAAAGKSAPQLPRYAARADAMATADEIAERRGWDRRWVRRVIGQCTQQPAVLKLMTPAPVDGPRVKNWEQYRSRMVDPARVRDGIRFWQSHRQTLERAQQEFGVPPEIIVGIIGVETRYGRHMGKHRVLDTLATLAFDFPPEHPRAQARGDYFKRELEQLLYLRRERGLSTHKLQGSYAGAMGMSQFMPSSWARYAVDYDGDGRIDLFNSPADAIGSIANYFRQFNWRSGMPTHYAVNFDPDRLDMPTLLAPDIRPTFDTGTLAAKGVILDESARDHQGPLALIELENGDQSPTYVAGTENFYVITRYNWSSHYAMAVIELGQAVASALTP